MLWLRYTDGTTTESMRFRELDVDSPTPSTERIVGRSLAGRGFQHKLFRYDRHVVRIGADETSNATKLTFLRAWWGADVQEISFDAGETAPTEWTEVLTEGGDFPQARVEDTLLLTVTLDMTTKETV